MRFSGSVQMSCAIRGPYEKTAPGFKGSLPFDEEVAERILNKKTIIVMLWSRVAIARRVKMGV
jgi:hypothetical protein